MTQSLAAVLIVLAFLQASPSSQTVHETTVLVDRIVFEPTKQPERIQIWGTFNGKRGFLYFRLPPGLPREYPDVALILSDWDYLEFVVSSGKPVQLQSLEVLRVHTDGEWPIAPSVYPRGADRGRLVKRDPALIREQFIEALKQ